MRWILCLMMLVSLGFAPAPVYRPKKNDTDLEKLQGTWIGLGVSLRRNGMPSKEYQSTESPSLVIRGTTLTFITSNNTTTMFEIMLNATKNELLLELGEKRVPFHAIYRVRGNELTVCLSNDSGTRPTSIEGGKMISVMTFKRSPKP